MGAKYPDATGRKTLDRTALLSALLLVAVGAVVYSNTFSVPFTLDDYRATVNNPRIRRLAEPWEVVRGSSRPVAELTFAANYALDGLEVRGYHAMNLAIHLAAALTLFGIVRRTLAGPRLGARYGPSADGLALAVALLWMVHPLQTQSVTYIVQRMESLAGLFYLLTLYCFIRAQDSPRTAWWHAAAVACCFLGMGTKEIMVTCPLMVLWYDRVFVAGSWREIARRRWGLYLGLGASWLFSAGLLWSVRAKMARSGVLVVEGLTPWEYALSQPGVILHYLRLSFWPRGQCVDYAWPVARTAGQIVPPLVAILALLGLTVWCMFRRPAWGFVGGWFFIILGPTSSIAPIRDLAFEHRMYLSLAAVAVAVVIGGYELLGWLVRKAGDDRLTPDQRRLVFVAPLVVLVLVLGTAAWFRNLVWADRLNFWSDVVIKAPHNTRGRVNLGRALTRIDPEAAARQFEAALAIDPRDYQAHQGLGLLLEERGDQAGARERFRRAVQSDPSAAEPHVNLARSLETTEPEQAIEHYRRAIELRPDLAVAHNNLGSLLTKRDRVPEAIECLEEALRIDPWYVNAHVNLAIALVRQGRTDDARRHVEEALRLKPDYRPRLESVPALQPLLDRQTANDHG